MSSTRTTRLRAAALAANNTPMQTQPEKHLRTGVSKGKAPAPPLQTLTPPNQHESNSSRTIDHTRGMYNNDEDNSEPPSREPEPPQGPGGSGGDDPDGNGDDGNDPDHEPAGPPPHDDDNDDDEDEPDQNPAMLIDAFQALTKAITGTKGPPKTKV